MYDKHASTSLNLNQLGKHFSLQWADEDVNQQIREGSRFPDLDTTPSTKRKLNSDDNYHQLKLNGFKLAKKPTTTQPVMTSADEPNFKYGPLTHRLLADLAEQNLLTPYQNEVKDAVDAEILNRPLPESPVKKVGRKPHLDKKIKKNGRLYEASEASCDSSDSMEHKLFNLGHTRNDEIANEIKMLHSELRLVSKQCKSMLGQLVETAKRSLEKQALKKKMNLLDAEVIIFSLLNVSISN